MKRPILLLLAISSWASVAIAQQEKDVEGLVRAYFAAFQRQEWEALIDMMHPKTLQELRNAILAKVPERSSDIDEAKRAELDELLSTLSVKTPEEARGLAAKDVYLRLLRKSSTTKAVISMKDVKTEIKHVSVQKEGEEYYADVDAESEFRGKLSSGTTHFVVKSFDGTLKVVAMTKTKQPPKKK